MATTARNATKISDANASLSSLRRRQKTCQGERARIAVGSTSTEDAPTVAGVSSRYPLASKQSSLRRSRRSLVAPVHCPRGTPSNAAVDAGTLVQIKYLASETEFASGDPTHGP